MTCQVWDHDRFTGDDFIGETVIDLEDRWFDEDWQKLGGGGGGDADSADRTDAASSGQNGGAGTSAEAKQGEKRTLTTMKRKKANSKKPRLKPVETRQLWKPTVAMPQGSLSLWIDILTPEQVLSPLFSLLSPLSPLSPYLFLSSLSHLSLLV